MTWQDDRDVGVGCGRCVSHLKGALHMHEDAKQKLCAPSSHSAIHYRQSLGSHIERHTAHLFPIQAPPLKCQLNLRRAILVLFPFPTKTRLQNLFHSHSFERVTCTTFSSSTGHSRLDPFDPWFLTRRDNRPGLPTTTRARCATDTVYIFSGAAFRWKIVLDDGAHPW